MKLAEWLRPPRRTLAVFLCLMLVLGGALGWLGWQLLKQDRALEGQRLQERLELAADQMAAALQQSLADLESYLSFVPSPGAKEPPDGVLVLQATKRSRRRLPARRPALLSRDSGRRRAAGGDLRRRRNPGVPAQRSGPERPRSSGSWPDRRIPGCAPAPCCAWGGTSAKPAAMRKPSKPTTSSPGSAGRSVLGLPAELMAREARGTVLEAIGKREELRKEASLLHSALWSGRWSLLRPAWEYHGEEAQRWLGARLLTEREQNALALSIAAESIYRQWTGRAGIERAPDLKIRRSAGADLLDGDFGSAGRRAGGARTTSVRQWAEALQGRSVQGALIDADGQVMIGSFDKSGPQAVRTAAATRLPGTLHATSADPGADDGGRCRAAPPAVRGIRGAGPGASGRLLFHHALHRPRAGRGQAPVRVRVGGVARIPDPAHVAAPAFGDAGQREGSHGRPAAEILRHPVPRKRAAAEARRVAAGFRPHRGARVPLSLRASRSRGVGARPGGRIPGEGRAPRAIASNWQLAGEYPLIHGRSRSARPGAAEPARQRGQVFAGLPHRLGRDGARTATAWPSVSGTRAWGFRLRSRRRSSRNSSAGAGSRAAHIQGTGIGLAMARHIVEAHGGEIRLESEPGRGSTFTILLPLEKKA